MGKKLLIADHIKPIVDHCFSSAGSGSSTAAIVGAFAYSLQLYFDFSGYTDMALGVSRCFGIELPENFNSPYKSKNISEFWTRWHITLSSFLRNYLYIPLGGNKRGEPRRMLNLFLTMFLGGLWHGSGMQFGVWGAIHGFYLIAYHRLFKKAVLPKPLSIGLTFIVVSFAWIPFRSSDLSQAGSMMRHFLKFHFDLGHAREIANLYVFESFIFLVGLLIVFCGSNINWISQRPPTTKQMVFAGLVFGLAFLQLGDANPFLYFSF